MLLFMMQPQGHQTDQFAVVAVGSEHLRDAAIDVAAVVEHGAQGWPRQ